MFTGILPFIDQSNTFSQIDLRFAYNETAETIAASQLAIPGFICPSNAWRPNPLDNEGYGCTDYAPTYYVDIDPETGLRDRFQRFAGALTSEFSRPRDITDGLSNTVFVAEDSGRDERMQPGHVYIDPVDSELRRFWRWAELDTSIGVSMGSNNNRSPQGGPADCPWTLNNCGPFEEIFRFHTGGAQLLLGDGSVRFVSESLDIGVLQALITRDGNEVIGEF